MDEQHAPDAAPEPRERAGGGPRIREARLWFRSVVAHAPDLLAVLDESGAVKYVSPSSEPLLGYPPNELVGHVLGSMTDVDLALLAQTLADQPGVPCHVEGTVRHRDGHALSFEGTVTNLLDDPVVQGYVVNARDVSERQEAERARRRSEMALRSVIQASPVAILAMARDGSVHVWNAACETMFGWPAAEIVGNKLPFDPDELDLATLTADAFAGAS